MSQLVVESEDRPALDISLLIIRLVVGTIFFVHGAQKTFGWFEGPGLAQIVKPAAEDGTGGMGPIGYLVSIGECFGGLGMILGFLTRFSAASNTVIMIGAIVMVHGHHFLLSKGGFEYNLALIGLTLPLVLLGPGKYSISRCCMPKSKKTGKTPVILD